MMSDLRKNKISKLNCYLISIFAIIASYACTHSDNLKSGQKTVQTENLNSRILVSKAKEKTIKKSAPIPKRPTSKDFTEFNKPYPGLSTDQLVSFEIGERVLSQGWKPSPSISKSIDGLGPIFNAKSCAECHINNGRGNYTKDRFGDLTSLVIKTNIEPHLEEDLDLLETDKFNFITHPVYGEQIQDKSINKIKPEATVNAEYKDVEIKYPDGDTVTLTKPTFRLANLNYGRLACKTFISPRIAPPLFGVGLLGSIPSSLLKANEDPEDLNDDGISGRASMVYSSTHKKLMFGRFGHKAEKANLSEKLKSEYFLNMGLSSDKTLSSSGECTRLQKDCLKAPSGKISKSKPYEVSKSKFEKVLTFLENLAPIKDTQKNSPSIKLGKEFFNQIECSSCHTPSYKTPKSFVKRLNGQKNIYPYTDLLLHDMGEGLEDGRDLKSAESREWKTPPLWGISKAKKANPNAGFLHDGRAKTIEEAILWHGGEAENSKNNFMNLPKSKRQNLLDFLNSI
jgi:CxxC motif-containing protein (DUF1111 family)